MPILKLKRKNSSEMDATIEDPNAEGEAMEVNPMIVEYSNLIAPAVILLSISLGLDNFYARLGMPFVTGLFLPQFWIMHLTLVTFLLGTGVFWYYAQEYLKKEVISYFIRRRSLNFGTESFVDIFTGFCFPCIVFPFWLSVREGSIECFLKRDCRNVFGVLYLGITDLLCNTTDKDVSEGCTPICEGIIYALPLLSFTILPVILAVVLHKRQVLLGLDTDSAESSPQPTPHDPSPTPVETEISPRLPILPVSMPKNFRPAQIRFSLPPHNIRPSSSVLGD